MMKKRKVNNMATYTINGVAYPGSTTVLDILDKSSALIPWGTGCMEKYILKELLKSEDNLVSKEWVAEITNSARFNFRDVSKEALDIGTQVHNLIEQYIKAKLKDESFDIKGAKDEVENGFLAFLEWEKNNVLEWLESESPIVCPVETIDGQKCFGYAGTLDIIARLKDEKVWCIDTKTSKGFYDGYGKQIASYKFGREKIKEKNTELKIVWKGKEDGENIEREYSVFLDPIKIDNIGVLRVDKYSGEPFFKDYTKNYDSRLNAFLKLLDFYYADKSRRLPGNIRTNSKAK